MGLQYELLEMGTYLNKFMNAKGVKYIESYVVFMLTS
jgi:hypothetical protein